MMKRTKKTFITVAVILIIVGAVVSISTLAAMKFDFTRLGTEKTITKSYTVEDRFKYIDIEGVSCDDVILLPSEKDDCMVTYKGIDNIILNVDLEPIYENNGFESIYMLKVNTDKSSLGGLHGLGFSDNKLYIYLSGSEYEKLRVRTYSGNIYLGEELSFGDATLKSTSGRIKSKASVSGDFMANTTSGDIKVNDISCETIDIHTRSGKIKGDALKGTEDMNLQSTSGEILLNNVKGEKLTVKSTSGAIKLLHTVLSDKMTLNSTSGSIRLDSCDANTLSIESRSGSVSGKLLSDKIYSTKTTSGLVSVPQSTNGGVCEVKTTSGNISFE